MKGKLGCHSFLFMLPCDMYMLQHEALVHAGGKNGDKSFFWGVRQIKGLLYSVHSRKQLIRTKGSLLGLNWDINNREFPFPRIHLLLHSRPEPYCR